MKVKKLSIRKGDILRLIGLVVTGVGGLIMSFGDWDKADQIAKETTLEVLQEQGALPEDSSEEVDEEEEV